jgi:acyl dehydratase
MIPLRDPEHDTGHADSFDDIPHEVDPAFLAETVASWGWRLDEFRKGTGSHGPESTEVTPGTIFEIEGRDTVTSAPELVRATLNLAYTHSDPAVGAYDRRRLVYGGHTISVAGAHATRALPDLVTILAWRSCDHTGPVFEEDVLRTELTVENVYPLDEGVLYDLQAEVFAERGESVGTGADEEHVLDWRFIALSV